MPRKQIYKITYPNGKIYVGMDLTGTITYFGSPSASAKERIAADLAGHRFDLSVRKEILWESETATDAEVRARERNFIRETGANNPAVGYNLTPRWSESAVAPNLTGTAATHPPGSRHRGTDRPEELRGLDQVENEGGNENDGP
jgi:hypothetical protein